MNGHPNEPPEPHPPGPDPDDLSLPDQDDIEVPPKEPPSPVKLDIRAQSLSCSGIKRTLQMGSITAATPPTASEPVIV
ncbi:hypothetical protein DFR37_103377 [Eoetvoesiella caeni]|uniref:Uncharacterized protein n=1 Tax=Eoetvoesiella caeni TaxID=645616 RepID=A0A366HF05_9BURK|nr:hypothetical protein DFR37_103377 [Eoetvoesiella caeni]